jgi:hypothetical protein
MRVIEKMKKFILSLVLITSGMFASAQQKIDAVRAYIDLTPAKVFLTSTQQFAFIAQIDSIGSKKYGIFLTSDSTLSEELISKDEEDVIVMEGTVFKPLSQFTKKQWRRLEKEIKVKFPYISQEQLSTMSFYFVFNTAIWPMDKYNEKVKIRPAVVTPKSTPTNTNTKSNGSGRPPH